MNTTQEETKRNKIIKDLYSSGAFTYQQLADRYGITKQRVQQIVIGVRKEILPSHNIELSKYETIEDYLTMRAKNNHLLNPIMENIKDIDITKKTKMKSGSRDRFRELIRLRDNYTCQLCGIKWTPDKRRLDTHHIFGDSIDSKAVGGDHLEMITLCHKCHLNVDAYKMRNISKGLDKGL